MPDNFLTFKQAKKVCKQHNVRSATIYKKEYKDMHPNLPSTPARVYKDKGWVDWPDFFSTTFLSYDEAKVICRKNKVNNSRDYLNRYKDIHPNLPSNPWTIYKNKGWTSCDIFLGRFEKYLSYEEASDICIDNNVRGITDYRARYKDIHPLLSSAPGRVYADKGWVDWKTFLNKYLNYEEARAVCLKHKFFSIVDYQKRHKLHHSNLPASPNLMYKNNGWIDWKTFLNK